jgi:hypothetical protein
MLPHIKQVGCAILQPIILQSICAYSIDWESSVKVKVSISFTYRRHLSNTAVRKVSLLYVNLGCIDLGFSREGMGPYYSCCWTNTAGLGWGLKGGHHRNTGRKERWLSLIRTLHKIEACEKKKSKRQWNYSYALTGDRDDANDWTTINSEFLRVEVLLNTNGQMDRVLVDKQIEVNDDTKRHDTIRWLVWTNGLR